MKGDAIGTHAEAAETIRLRREYFLAWKALGMLEAVFADAPQGALDTARRRVAHDSVPRFPARTPAFP